MVSKKNIGLSFWVLLGLIILLLVCSLFSSYLTPYDPYSTNPDKILTGPGREHLLGTDSHGRDILSRIIVGSKTSIFSAFAIIATVATIGTLIGLFGGYYGGRLDAWLMRITDIFLAFPDIVLAIAVAGVLGGGLINAMIALMFTSWTQYARLARSLTIGIKEEPFLHAARLSGCPDRRILFVHILPNILGTLVVTATLHISTMMMALAGLSFLGLGVKVPEAEWGSMISEGREYLQTAPWVTLFTSSAIVMVMMLFNLFGDQVRDMLDPKCKD